MPFKKKKEGRKEKFFQMKASWGGHGVSRLVLTRLRGPEGKKAQLQFTEAGAGRKPYFKTFFLRKFISCFDDQIIAISGEENGARTPRKAYTSPPCSWK